MPILSGAPLRTASRLMGFPEGTGELLVPEVRVKLLLSVLGSVLLAGLDTLGVLAMVPMMQFVSGSSTDEGALGRINQFLGDPGDSVLVATIAIGIVTAFVLKDVIAIALRRWQLRFMGDQVVRTSADMLRGYLTGPYFRHLNYNPADRAWLADGGVQIAYSNGIAAALAVLTEAMTIALILAGLMFVSPLATAGALVYFGGAALVLYLTLRRRTTVIGDRVLVASRDSNRIALQAMGAAKEIKVRRAHDTFMKGYVAARTETARASASQQLLGELPKYLLEVLLVVGVGLMAVLASQDGPEGSQLLLLGVFVAASSRIVPSIMRLMASLNNIRFAHQAIALLIAERRETREMTDAADEEVRTEAVPAGDITVDNLCFAYQGHESRQVLQDVSFQIVAGESIAFVGGSGAGKSTLVDLLLGLHRPTRGHIYAGGVDIRHNLPGWQKQLAVVPQDVYLLDDTFQANIAFDLPLEPERMAEVVDRAQLSDLVKGLDAGLESQVGDRGMLLSGGQRQRIGIARALYRRPSVLVLDEATSALDNEIEHRISETIRALRGELTLIIVAHRLTTVQHSDKIVLLSGGRVSAVGSFAELTRSSDEFANLVRLGTLAPGLHPVGDEGLPTSQV